jgi:hypothetical protein
LRLKVFKIVEIVAGYSLNCTPKAPLPADSRGGGARAGPAVSPKALLSNSSSKICDIEQQKPQVAVQEGLKKPGADPIKTLNVVTGPPEVGEVNTSKALEGPVDKLSGVLTCH